LDAAGITTFAPDYEASRSMEYVIIYRIDGADTLILHVFHGRRDIPRCWTNSAI